VVTFETTRTAIRLQTACHFNTGCLAKGLKILAFMAMYCIIANIWHWCTCSVVHHKAPCDDPYYVNWYNHKVHWL